MKKDSSRPAARGRRLIRAATVLLAATPAFAAVVDVNIQGFAFSPSSVTVNVGETVRWTQRDSAPHTATSDTGLWDSGLLSLNRQFSFAFNNAGTFRYHCAPHPFMTGTVVVRAVTPNVPPTVSLSSPTNGAAYPIGTNLTLVASASDSDGQVTRVQFLDGATSLGVVTTPPYQITIALVTPGGHSFTAVATDNQGATTTSTPVTVYVNTVPINDPIPGRIAKGSITADLRVLVEGLVSPLGLAAPDDGTGRLFVYDQVGLAWVVTANGKAPEPLLDVQARLVPLGRYDERGLLGLATHPNFGQHPLVYTYTSEPNAGPADFPVEMPAGVTNNHQSVIAEWRMDASNPNRIDPASRRELLRLDEPQPNHNGGTLRFGPDGYLYVALGDGGAADDQGNGHMPSGNAQDVQMTVLGKFLRLDADGRDSANGKYGIPATNPFAGGGGIPEIYAYGLRNPFGFSFDQTTGELYAGDVGQNKVEEINLIVNGGNYGWNLKEGSFFFDPNSTGSGYVTATPLRPPPADLVDPIAEYDHDEGSAIIGGAVYRGTQVPALVGRYVFGDWGAFGTPSGRLFYLEADHTIKSLTLGLEDRALGLWLKGFGQGVDGELYVFGSTSLGPSGATGKMLGIIAPPPVVRFASVATSGAGQLVLSWTGGIGPYSLQQKNTLADSVWTEVGNTSARQISAPATSANGFFRVIDLGR